MSILLVDIGNTRIKWVRVDGGRLGARHAAAHGNWKIADFSRRLFGDRARAGVRATAVTRVVASSVAGGRVDARLRSAARAYGVRVHFVQSVRVGGGVRVGYAEPWRLGVDRFAAIVGAHGLFPAIPLLVIAVGTAMTLDLVSGEGRHHGGAIVPAPDLMIQTLLARTHGIRRRARGGSNAARGPFGRSTRAGVEQGARYAAAALIDRAVDDARALVGRPPLVVLSGGDSAAVRGLVHSRAVTVPDLVLRGLAVLATEVLI
ncbi:MAG: type III pantothenate kinase [Proteobacteria bacterium]|nr:type III pantothenate kinase [Pseudomonadota bacterium]